MDEIEVALTHAGVEVVPRKRVKISDHSVSWPITDKGQFDSIAVYDVNGSSSFCPFARTYDVNAEDTVVVGLTWNKTNNNN